MRLHHLEIQAFGPFAASGTVDLDRLSAAGLFLLSGATGSGKTSVLDAVCFALYGDVPGDRSGAKRLRSDQAAAGLAPRVVLEATLSGRRFRFARSPQWERAKKRGTGTTTEQASVVVSERMRGDWVVLSTRLDEAGQLVSGLVGMTLTQFTQVAMLPQGRFQTFLRARSEDRHRLLQQLFRTGRFEDVERWLREHRLELRRQVEQAHQEVADLLARVSETAGVALPEVWAPRDLATPLREGDVAAWLTSRLDEAGHAVGIAADAVGDAVEHEQLARADLDLARAVAARRERHLRALSERDEVARAEPQHATDRRRLTAARQAAPVVPLVRAEQAAATRLARSEQAAAASAVTAASAGGADSDPGDLVEPGWLDTAHAALDAALTAARVVVPRERELAGLRAEVTRLDRAVQVAAGHVDRLLARAEALPDRLGAARTALAEADDAGRRVLVLEPQHGALHEQLVARRELDRTRPLLLAARVAHVEARDASLASRQALLDAREARLESMAAEIAGRLAVGDSCPVCGSCDHPHRAEAHAGAVDAGAEELAQRALDDAQALELLRDVERRDLQHLHDALLARAGDAGPAAEVADVEQRLADLEAALTAARALAGSALEHRAACASLEQERDQVQEQIAVARAEAASAASRRDTVEATVQQVRAEVDAALAGTDHDTAGALVLDLQQRLAAVETAARDHAEVERCRTAHDEARDALAVGLRQAGLPDADAVTSAALEQTTVDALARTVEAHDARRSAAEAVLAELGAGGEGEDGVPEPPDLPGAEQQHAAAASALADARGRATRSAAVHERLQALAEALDVATQRWAPLDQQLDLATRVSTFAEGRSADNRLQMRLSAYVLAHRLSQVVAAANERLARMSDHRYSLEHTARRGAGENRGGLSILVRDDWSGESRDPATLSGGETFVVSLALALGLADVITQEAGGADLDTLFVDEGFGSLDADTLDDVMDVLDTLRDGGRVVGVVSHVAEMRDRIPTRLLVAKSRTGSTLTQVP